MRKTLVNQQCLTQKLLQLSLLCAMLLMPKFAWAQTFSGGDGSEDNPYIISSFNDLMTLSTYVNNGTLTTEHFKLDDGLMYIDCENKQGFIPIGNLDHPFKGTFDGVSTGMYISKLEYTMSNAAGYNGLFGVIDGGTVKNLKLANCKFIGGNEVGAIVGFLKSGTIEGCSVATCTVTSGNAQNVSVGGVAGTVNDGVITGCSVFATAITGSTNYSEVGDAYAGGIVGNIYSGDNDEVEISSNTIAQGTTATTVLSSHATPASIAAGGIVGQCDGFNITISENTVKDNTSISSVDGNNDDNDYSCSGAIVGQKGESVAFSGNYYYYTVTTSTTKNDNSTEKNEYETRGTGSIVSEDCYDIIEENGAILYTKKLTLTGVFLGLHSFEGGFEYYAPLSDFEDQTYYIAPDQDITFYLFPDNKTTPTVSVTYTLPDASAPTTTYPENIAEQGEFEYSFKMPNADADFNVGIEGCIGLTINNNLVTSANASNIEGDGISPGQNGGSVSFDAESNTLTLNNVSIYTVSSKPIVVSDLDNLTVKITGNSLFNFNDVDPTYVFKSTKENAVLKFITTDPSAVLTIPYYEEGIADGFSKIQYENGLVLIPGSANNPNKIQKVYLTIGDMAVTDNNAADVFVGTENEGKVSFTPASSTNGNVNILSLNGASLEGNIISGVGDLKIVIQGENTIAVRDTAAVIRSTNGGKLRISKPEAEQSPTLVLSNTRESQSLYYHAPAIKDFASFELEEGLYMSNTRAYTSNNYETPAVYDTYINNYGGQTTKGLIDPTDMDKGSKGIRNVTISTTVAYPIWVAGKQVTPDNATDIFTGTDNAEKVSFTYGTDNNGNVNTLTLTGATLSDATVTSLPNLTIEFSKESTLGNAGGTYGFIHNSNPDAVLTFKALSTDAEITIHACNDYASVEGFKNVVFENAKVNGDATYNTTARTFVDQYGPETWLTVSADLSPYGLTIGDVAVNSFNADNILGDGKVSYDPDKYELTLNNATIGSDTEAKNITFNGTALTIVLKGTNTLYGGFTRTETNSKGNLSFYTDAKNVTSLTMSTDIPTDKFELSYQNGLKKDGLVISLPTDYGISVAGTLITPANRTAVTGAGISGGVSFDSNGMLVLYGATISGAIEVTDASKLPEEGLTIHLAGNSTITNTTGNAIRLSGATAGKLTFATSGENPGKLVTSSTAATMESAFQNFAVACENNLDSKVEGSNVTVAPALDLYVTGAATTAETTYATEMTASTNTNGTTIDGLHYTMGDGQNSKDEGGPDDVNGKTKLVFTDNTAMTQDKVDESANLTPATSAFDAIFKGITGMLPAGENLIELLGVEIAENYDLFVKIGKQDPVAIKQLIEMIGEEKVAKIKAVLSESAMFQIYLMKTGSSPAPAKKVDHHIGPKSSVAGALGGVKVSNSSVQNSAGPATTYKAMEVATMAAAIADLGDAHNGYSCNDPDITDLADNMFIDNGGSSAPRRAGKISGTILPEGLTFLDFSGTSITGMEISREKGAFNGVPENVFIYMPAGNSVAAGTKNVVIGDICDVVELNGSTDAKPFKAKKDFKAAQATLKRAFDAGSDDSKATIYLPYNIEQEDADKLGKFYKYDGNNGTTVSMTKVTTGGLKANMPYIFEAKEGGGVDPLVRVVDVVANPAETEGFKGTFERKDYEAGMYCYAAEATSENAKGQFVEMGPRSFVPPFRAYIIGSGVPSYAIAWDGIIDNMDDDENTTAVESVKTIGSEKTREGWWTLNGMRMTEKPKKAGLYILNGRMVVVKN